MALVKFFRASAAAAGLLALAGLTHADAADIYAGGGYKDVPPPVSPWAGFYIGGNLGIDWAHIDTQNNIFWNNWGCQNGCTFGGNHLETTGGFGGGQIGYNWQWSPSFVVGLELDLGGLADDDRRFVNIDRFHNVSLETQGGFYGDITGRIGYTWGPAMIYAKGGFAWLNTDFKASESNLWTGQTFATNGNDNNTLTGWTVGAGLEWLVSPSWSIKVEYLHFDFSLDNNNFCCGDGIPDNNFRFFKNDLQVDTVKLGFNYFFHPTYTPLK